MDVTEGIGRRDFGSAMATAALLMVASCNEGARGPSIDHELSALGDAISSLESTVRRFSSEDWKDVVPDVETDASDVANALANLKAAMGKQ